MSPDQLPVIHDSLLIDVFSDSRWWPATAPKEAIRVAIRVSEANSAWRMAFS
jgi:hypothetical protein